MAQDLTLENSLILGLDILRYVSRYGPFPLDHMCILVPFSQATSGK